MDERRVPGVTKALGVPAGPPVGKDGDEEGPEAEAEAEVAAAAIAARCLINDCSYACRSL